MGRTPVGRGSWFAPGTVEVESVDRVDWSHFLRELRGAVVQVIRMRIETLHPE